MTDNQTYVTARSPLFKSHVLTTSSAKEFIALYRRERMYTPQFENHPVALQGFKQMLKVILHDEIGQQHRAEVARSCQPIRRS